MKEAAGKTPPETCSGIAGAVTHRATGLTAAWLDRAGTVATGKASCLWAVSPRWARVCWWPIWRWRWPPAKTAPASAYRLRAVFWSVSSNCPRRSLLARLASMRRSVGTAADQNLLVDTRASGHLLSAPQGLNHFLNAARQAAAEVIVLDPLYSTHDQDENDTRSMAALCQSLLRLRDASQAALIVVHHVRKSIGRDEIGSAFRGSSALHAVGDSYLLLTRPRPICPPPSSCASSSAMPLRRRPDCCNWIRRRCVFPPPVWRPPRPPPRKRWSRST